MTSGGKDGDPRQSKDPRKGWNLDSPMPQPPRLQLLNRAPFREELSPGQRSGNPKTRTFPARVIEQNGARTKGSSRKIPRSGRVWHSRAQTNEGGREFTITPVRKGKGVQGKRAPRGGPANPFGRRTVTKVNIKKKGSVQLFRNGKRGEGTAVDSNVQSRQEIVFPETPSWRESKTYSCGPFRGGVVQRKKNAQMPAD